MMHLVAPGLEHQFPPPWQAKAEEVYSKHVVRGRPQYPERVRFVTYTLKYPSCYWVEVIGLDRHYRQASVDARHSEDGFVVQTANVRALHLALPTGLPRQPVDVSLDGQKLRVQPYANRSGDLHLYLEKRDGSWKEALPERLLVDRYRRPQKTTGLQGPIDDAFTGPFLCVKGTGQPWHEATQRSADENLKRFQQEWDKYWRGELEVKEDTAVTPEDLASKNLILFGDPASNSLINQVLDGLPLRWTKDEVTLAGKRFAASTHVPVLIHPSPLHPERYVVLNSGHTFHAPEFQGSNALLYPRLGDYAVLKVTGDGSDPRAVEVEMAGLFDDYWQPRDGK
jgi:hypothetical protein